MAKEQQTIDGAADKVTPEVRAVAEHYAAALCQWQGLQADLEILRATLIEKMGADDIAELEVTIVVGPGDTTVRYEVKRDPGEPKPKIKCKKLGEE